MGEIQSSNFAEWKSELIEKIRSIKTELYTDDDFIRAIDHVKIFKAAETILKEAKQSAIDQSPDIHRLFEAIDEVSDQARSARLSLERQIKRQKEERKELCILSGIQEIRSFIRQQNPDFQSIDHSCYVERSRFEYATKGKTSLDGVQTAIYKLCEQTKLDIRQKATEVAVNSLTINALPRNHQLLFQDRTSLITLSQRELESTIAIRLAESEKTTATVKIPSGVDVSSISKGPSASNCSPETKEHNYRITIQLKTQEHVATSIARGIRDAYGHLASVKLMRE